MRASHCDLPERKYTNYSKLCQNKDEYLLRRSSSTKFAPLPRTKLYSFLIELKISDYQLDPYHKKTLEKSGKWVIIPF